MSDITPYLAINDYLQDNLFDPTGIDKSVLLQTIAKKLSLEGSTIVVESEAGIFAIITDIDRIGVDSDPVRANIDGYQRRALDGMTKTNQLKTDIPNFVFVYGFLPLGQPIMHNEDVILCMGVRETPYIFQEHIPGAMQLRDFMDRSIPIDRFLVVFQLLLAMKYAQDRAQGYTHGKLSRCIFVRDLGSVQSIEYPYLSSLESVSRSITIQSRYIPYIHGSVDDSNDSDLRDIVDLLRQDVWYAHMDGHKDYSRLIEYLITNFIRDVQIQPKPEAILGELPTQEPQYGVSRMNVPGIELFIQFYGRGIQTKESQTQTRNLLRILDVYIQSVENGLPEQAAGAMEGIEAVVPLASRNMYITRDWMQSWTITIGLQIVAYKNYLLAQVIRNYVVETFGAGRFQPVRRNLYAESVVTRYNTEMSKIRQNLRKGLLIRSNVQLIDLVLFPSTFHILDYSRFDRFADLPIDIQVSIADLLDYTDLSRLCNLGLCTHPRLQDLLRRKDVKRHIDDVRRVLDSGGVVSGYNAHTKLSLGQGKIYDTSDGTILDSIPGVSDRDRYTAEIQDLSKVVQWLYNNGYRIEILIDGYRYAYPEEAHLLDLGL